MLIKAMEGGAPVKEQSLEEKRAELEALLNAFGQTIATPASPQPAEPAPPAEVIFPEPEPPAEEIPPEPEPPAETILPEPEPPAEEFLSEPEPEPEETVFPADVFTETEEEELDEDYAEFDMSYG